MEVSLYRRINLEQSKSITFLTAALVMVTIWGVIAAEWTKGLNMLTFIGIGAILIGIMLARSVLPAIVAHIFALVIGVAWAFWVTSRLLPTSYNWLDRWENLALRLYNWYLIAMQGGVSYDNLMFIFQMGFILWVVGYLTIWFVLRSGSPWLAIVPGGLVLLINFYYRGDVTNIATWFVLYLVIALLLVVRFNLLEHQIRWRSEGIFFRPDINFDFFRDGLIFSVLVVGFAWFMPPLVDAKTIGVLDEFQGSWREMQNEWNRLFADLNYQEQAVYDSFGASLTLGGARQLSDDLVMDVNVKGVGRYWRAAVYDYYSGDGWVTTDDDRSSFGPNADTLALPVFNMREPVTQTYTFYRDNATVLYGMNAPIALDRSARVNFNALPDELVTQEAAIPGWTAPGDPWVEEITYMRSNATVDKDEVYQVVSLASRATTSQLEEAGVDYPTWVTDRYLNLPPSTTDRTRQLARELAAPHQNNFAKTQAIERYLRNNITYNESIPTPPPGVDKVDYIVFTSQEAYCDYYATSMIVMLRSLGIPARLAAGFARGTYNGEKDAFEVRNRDAHSWVEVYFPEYGWIEFEPTAAQPTIIRPTNSENEQAFAAGSFFPENLPERNGGNEPENIPIDDEVVAGGDLSSGISLAFLGWNVSLPAAAVLIIAVPLLVGGIALALGTLWWQSQKTVTTSRAQDIFQVYKKMLNLAGWMGHQIRPWQTPYEHAAVLERSLPEQQQSLQLITNEYVRQAYSRQEQAINGEVGHAWYRLRHVMIRQTIKRYLPEWLGRYV
jgi:transglutaminase-like putative cysteine protease